MVNIGDFLVARLDYPSAPSAKRLTAGRKYVILSIDGIAGTYCVFDDVGVRSYFPAIYFSHQVPTTGQAFTYAQAAQAGSQNWIRGGSVAAAPAPLSPCPYQIKVGYQAQSVAATVTLRTSDLKTGQEIVCTDNLCTPLTLGAHYKIIKVGDIYIYLKNDLGEVTGFLPTRFALITSPYATSPELYQPGEAQRAAAFKDKRAYLGSILGLSEKQLEQEENKDKEAANSVWECPYEAYDTKYGDW